MTVIVYDTAGELTCMMLIRCDRDVYAISVSDQIIVKVTEYTAQ